MLLLSVSADAKDFTCRDALDKVRIRIEVDDQQTGLPCRVLFESSPTDRQVLWRAQRDAGFCERKMQNLLTWFTKEGWRCSPRSAPPRGVVPVM